jgi:hypothetical protein
MPTGKITKTYRKVKLDLLGGATISAALTSLWPTPRTPRRRTAMCSLSGYQRFEYIGWSALALKWHPSALYPAQTRPSYEHRHCRCPGICYYCLADQSHTTPISHR